MMKTLEAAQMRDLIQMMSEAMDYLTKDPRGNWQTQTDVARTLCESVLILHEFVGNDPVLEAQYSRLIEASQFSSIEEREEFIERFIQWDDEIERYRELFFSDHVELDPLPKEKRRVLNSTDIVFYEMMDAIGDQTKEKVSYHIRKCFNKLLAENKTIISNYMESFRFWGSLRPEKGDYTLLENRATALKDNQERFLWLYEHLEDYRSKKTLYAILNNWYNFDFVTLTQVKESCFKDYFDLDILNCDEREVMVDLGAYIGDSVIDYVSTYGVKYKRIYCYEITPETIRVLKENLKNLPNIVFRAVGASDKKGCFYITPNASSTSANILSESGELAIQTVAIDEDILEPVTLIKMDIEGSEQSALRGCARHIREEHPKLAISVYHNNEDIWKIAHMVYEIDPSYRFYLRHNGGNLIPTEYVLLAI